MRDSKTSNSYTLSHEERTCSISSITARLFFALPTHPAPCARALPTDLDQISHHARSQKPQTPPMEAGRPSALLRFASERIASQLALASSSRLGVIDRQRCAKELIAGRSESSRLDGRERWSRRPCGRLARAPKAVAGRPLARPFALGVPSRPEPPRGGAAAEPQGRRSTMLRARKGLARYLLWPYLLWLYLLWLYMLRRVRASHASSTPCSHTSASTAPTCRGRW